jgi:hypothetical protein
MVSKHKISHVYALTHHQWLWGIYSTKNEKYNKILQELQQDKTMDDRSFIHSTVIVMERVRGRKITSYREKNWQDFYHIHIYFGRG